MLERTITTQSVEARAFRDGAVKVRRFETVGEADEWITGLRLQHDGVQAEIIEHRTELGISQLRSKAAEREWKPSDAG